MLVGDIIVAVEKDPVKDGTGLVDRLKKTKPGDEVEFKVKRKDQEGPLAVKVKLGRRV